MKTRTKVSIAIPFATVSGDVDCQHRRQCKPLRHLQSTTATPIKHVVVIFDENVSTDHYFATYPNAANPPNEPQFTAAPDTPARNGLTGLS